MLDSPAQSGMYAQLESSAGADTLLMRRMDGTEGLSELFEYRVEAISEETDLDLTSLVGTNASVKFDMEDKGERVFNGFVTEARWVGNEGQYTRYELVLRPWLWFLTRTTDSQIFKDETALDIVKKVFSDAGYTDIEDKTTGSYPSIHYCVQYMETHFNFVSRMMEKWGMYYYFKHEAGKHTLVIADGLSSHEAVPSFANVKFFGDPNWRNRDQEHIYQWSASQALRTGKVVYKDYAYERASSDIKDEHLEQAGHEKDNLELYVYPGGYSQKADGKSLAKYRVQAERAQTERRFAAGTVPGFFPGGLFTLEQHPNGSQNIEYLIVRCTHTVVNPAYHSGPAASGFPYHGAYETMPSSVQFRAPIRTPRALIPGPQSAIVVGGDGDPETTEEINVDDKGRILVMFYWDRYKKASKRLRIAQGIAGAGWGMQYTPRVGQEVLIGHVEGDPDQPFVMSSAYNSDNEAPISMPGDKTQSTWKSSTHMDTSGFNEIRFEDKPGQEQIYMHAQYDHVREVLHDETITVKNDRTKTIEEGNETWEITQGDQTFDIVQGKRTTTINGDDKFTLKQGSWINEIKMGNWNNTVKMGNWDNQIKMGNWTNKVSLGKCTIEAMQKIELKVGSNKITIDQMGVKIKGMMCEMKADTMCTVKGLMTTVKGDAMLTLKGGITMIN